MAAVKTATSTRPSRVRSTPDRYSDVSPPPAAKKPSPPPPKAAIKRAATKKTPAATKKTPAAAKKTAPSANTKTPRGTTGLTPAQKGAITRANNKRKREEVAAAPAPAPAAKKQKITPKAPILTSPPKKRTHVLAFGEGGSCELGLGSKSSAINVKRPRLNKSLAADKVGVVQLAAGAMHSVALTHDNKILTWGVNDEKALGRVTLSWDGEPLEEDEDDDSGMNPLESNPAEVDVSGLGLAEGTRWTQVAASDNATFALTDDGRVAGWGNFRTGNGAIGFRTGGDKKGQLEPMMIPEVKDIVEIATGANHVLVKDKKGGVMGWGAGDGNQLGRRSVERTQVNTLVPREFGLPKNAKGITKLAAGDFHSFALNKEGKLYAWGLNNFGQLGMEETAGSDEAFILKPKVVEALADKKVISIAGGIKHTVFVTDEGEALFAGMTGAAQSGIMDNDLAKLPSEHVLMSIASEREASKVAGIHYPTKVPGIKGKAVSVAACGDQSIVITEEGKAWSFGYNANYACGQGDEEYIREATMIDNKAVKDLKIVGAASGAQFGMLLAEVESAPSSGA